jgi:DNA-binding transcriptional LysR family regulator
MNISTQREIDRNKSTNQIGSWRKRLYLWTGAYACMIEYRHLRYFVVLARTLHMTRASEQLHLAQPSLSQNIQQLEEELGTTLIRRTGHKLSLTDAGEVFSVEAQKSIQQFELAKVAAQKAGRGELGEIALGFGSISGVQVIPRLLSVFREKFPEVQIRLSEMGTEAQLSALRSGDIDLAIVYALPDPEFQYREMTPESLVAILPASHPHAAEESVSIKDLAADAFNSAIEKCRGKGARRRPHRMRG